MRISTPKIPGHIVPLIVVFAVLVLFMPRTAKFNYDYRKGSRWPYENLVSQFDFPILKTEEQMMAEREEAGTVVVPYYRYSDDVVNQQVKAVQGMDLGRWNSLRPAIVSRLGELYAKGIISEAKVKLEGSSASVSQDVIYIQRNKRAAKYPRTEVYKVSEAQNELAAQLGLRHPDLNADSLLRRSGVYDAIVPNLIFDRSMTELGHASSADYISPTAGYIRADQKIIGTGDIVTPEIAQILDSYKAEYNKVFGYDGPRVLLYLGNILLALALVVILYLAIFCTNRLIFTDFRRYTYLLTIFLLTAVATFVFQRYAQSLIYLMPYSVIALYLLAFFKKRVVLPVYVVSLLPLLMFSGNGMELFVIFLTSGIVTINTFQYFSKGWLQFVNALIVFVVQLLVFTGFRLVDAGQSVIWVHILQLFAGSMLMVAFYPLIFLFERIFNLVSTTKLAELADTGSPLLQELSSKAPGTFQHCLSVMHLVEEAGRAVGANVPLLRAGALYHDLGKVRNPQCFIENQTAIAGAPAYHEGKDPKESAREITRHVADGLEIARQHNLPEVICDFIVTHQGTSSTRFFLNEYLRAGGDPSDIADFYYPAPGRKPTTKEQVLLMICDSVEAASRSLKSLTPEAFDRLVEGIVQGKEEDGQFDEADISIKELNTVKDVLKKQLRQMYHGRVEY